MSYEHSPVFVKAYDLIAWLLPQTQGFPKSQRFVLAKRVEDAALDVQEALIAAGKTQRAEQRRYLLQADIRLEQLRLFWRLCHTLDLVPLGRYAHGARMIDEVGRLLGGWIASVE